MPTQNQIRESITDQIVEHLKAGKVAPWRRPWSLDRNAGAATNVVSKKPYKGINPLLLAVSSMRHGFQSKWWATFNQWKKLGGSVMRRPHNIPPGQWGRTLSSGVGLRRQRPIHTGRSKKRATPSSRPIPSSALIRSRAAASITFGWATRMPSWKPAR